VRLRRPDGTERVIAYTAVPVPAGSEQQGHVLFVLHDVTQRFEAEQALREREARFRTVFSSIDEGYCLCEMILDDEGRPIDYRFLEVNALFESMTGLVDPVGHTARELVPSLEDHWVDTYGRVALQGEARRFESGSDAMGRWFDVFATPVEPWGRFALVFKDVTERREAQARLLTALAVKDEFLGLVSHELRTPLTVVYGMSRLLARGVEPEAARAIAADIAESADELNDLVESMLLLARLDRDEAGQLREPVLLHRAAMDVIERQQQKDPGRRYDLRIGTAHTLVDVQPGWIARVIENLVGNAAKYSDPGTPISIAVEGDQHEVRVRVLDEGPSLREEEIPLLFDAFYRSPHTQGAASGAGLGLAVSKRIVELLGGRIWASVRPSCGAEFGFALPLAGEPEE
jgi:PAS domain S-box-containing protein